MTECIPDPFEIIETGDWVEVDADTGTITVTKRPGSREEERAEVSA
jgi:uncharacterized protein